VSASYDLTVTADVDIARVATAIGHRARATILSALHEGTPRPGGELGRRAGIAASTASEHLAHLVDAGLVAVDRRGRHRFYRLASDDVAHAWEALSLIAPPKEVRTLRAASVGAALAQARTCYDHLAGRLGVAVTDALLGAGAVVDRDGGAARSSRCSAARAAGAHATNRRRPREHPARRVPSRGRSPRTSPARWARRSLPPASSAAGSSAFPRRAPCASPTPGARAFALRSASSSALARVGP